MNANLIELDDHRPKVTEWMYCLFCGKVHYSQHLKGENYSKCPNCDETASVPEWRVEFGR